MTHNEQINIQTIYNHSFKLMNKKNNEENSLIVFIWLISHLAPSVSPWWSQSRTLASPLRCLTARCFLVYWTPPWGPAAGNSHSIGKPSSTFLQKHHLESSCCLNRTLLNSNHCFYDPRDPVGFEGEVGSPGPRSLPGALWDAPCFKGGGQELS